jgi:hypothetical protein
VVATRQPVTVRLTPAQALRMERMGEALWPTEKLSAGEVTRRAGSDAVCYGVRASATSVGAGCPCPNREILTHAKSAFKSRVNPLRHRWRLGEATG